MSSAVPGMRDPDTDSPGALALRPEQCDRSHIEMKSVEHLRTILAVALLWILR
jgi:hypothetical protein